MQLVLQQDAAVAEWLFSISRCRPMQFNMAIGLADDATGALVGGILFTNWNGSDIEIHVYWPVHLTRRIVRLIFGIAAMQFHVNRVTIRTRKDHMARGVKKLGAIYEGTIRRLYCPTDEPRHAGE